ncbi:MAG: dethiobiotin synthase, partial [Porticoccus sp.]|nr:dethiobiotin synthase [Porticoccus sp.]
RTSEGLRNDDAIKLMEQSSVDFHYDTVNPFAFEPYIAPHIAANETNTQIDFDVIKKAYLAISDAVDIVIIEGAGGWMVPVNEGQTMADLAVFLGQPVINVVGIRLGCLSHALLTTQAIEASSLPLAGWIANHLSSETMRGQENIATLENKITAPCLGKISHMKDLNPSTASSYLNISTLLS